MAKVAKPKEPPPAPDSNPVLLDALRKILDGQPRPIQGPPTAPGIFAGGAGGAALAKVALDERFIEEVTAPVTW